MSNNKELLDFKNWPIEKLQDEYYKLRVQNAALKLQETLALQAQQEVEELAERFNNFLRRDG